MRRSDTRVVVVTVIAVAAMIVTGPLSAQRAPGRKTAANQCRVDSTAAWYRRQREWLDDSKHDWTNDTLRTRLLQAAGVDARTALAVQLGVNVAGRGSAAAPGLALDSVAAQLSRVGRGGLWPLKSVVGAAGVRVVGMAALADSTFTLTALRRMQEAGPSESFAADVAVLEDRTRLLRGRKQLYGTQFRVGDGGKVVLAAMEDSAHADLRREGAGLPPFAVGLCVAKTTR